MLAKHANHQIVILLLRQTRYRNGTDHAHVADDYRKGATMGSELIGVQVGAILHGRLLALVEGTREEGTVSETVDYSVLPLDPFIIVGRGARQGTVEELLTVPTQVERHRLVLTPRRLHQSKAQGERRLIGELAELQHFFLPIQLDQLPLVVFRHVDLLCRDPFPRSTGPGDEPTDGQVGSRIDVTVKTRPK